MPRLTIKTPPNFGFRRTVLSHGWCELVPFSLNRTNWTLTRVLSLPGRQPVTAEISFADATVHIKIGDQLSAFDREHVKRQVAHMLRLDDDMALFYSMASADENLKWITTEGAGRMLRSPTVFEDLVKMICTTNCSWALTEKMINSLVGELGETTTDGRKSFPTAEQMAAMPVSFFKDRLSAGYRAPYLKELSEKVASRELNVEDWLHSELSAQELKKAMKKVKGVGDYVAENMLKLVGRYHGLALDSWVRSRFAELHNKKKPASDKKIQKYYSRYGDWCGLILWCDVTRDWIDASH